MILFCLFVFCLLTIIYNQKYNWTLTYLEWFLLISDKFFRPPAGHVMNSRTMPGGTAATGELCFEHAHSTPGRMVSQSTDRPDCPVDPWEGISGACEDADDSPQLLDTDHPLCQLDVRLLRHKACWINPLCVEQPLQDLCPQRTTVQSSGKHLVVDTPSPVGIPLLSHRDSLAETPLSENTANGPGGKNGDFSLVTEEQEVHPQHKSLLKNPKTVATSPCPKEDSARFESPPLTASADDGNSTWWLPLFFSIHVFVWAWLKSLPIVLPWETKFMAFCFDQEPMRELL